MGGWEIAQLFLFIFQNFPKLERYEEDQENERQDENSKFPEDLDYLEFYALSVKENQFPKFKQESFEKITSLGDYLIPIEPDLLCQEQI